MIVKNTHTHKIGDLPSGTALSMPENPTRILITTNLWTHKTKSSRDEMTYGFEQTSKHNLRILIDSVGCSYVYEPDMKCIAYQAVLKLTDIFKGIE